MSATTCHDFKSPRSDISKRLPPIFMMVPLVFYVVLSFGTLVGVRSFLGYREAIASRDYWRSFQAEQEAEKATTEEQKNAITVEKWKSEHLAQWVEGTRALQPISVGITRCVPPEITLAELTLERSIEIPSQINLNVRINNGGVEEVTKIQNVITGLSYRPYNSQQLKSGDALEFRSMLVWTN